jgi:WD40 repeat protein
MLASMLLGGTSAAQEIARLAPSHVIEFGRQQRIGPAVVSAVAISADGRRLAAVGDDHSVRLWDRESGQLLYRLAGHTDWVRAVAFSPNGKVLASAGSDRTIRLWDPATGRLIKTLPPHDQAITVLAFSPDGRQLAAAGFQKTLFLYDAASGRALRDLSCPSVDIRALAFSPSGDRLAAAGRDGKIRIWNMTLGQPERDVAERNIQAHRRRIRSLVFSPDGRRLASAGEGRHIRLWDTATGRELLSIPCGPTRVQAMDFTGDDELAVGGSDNVIRRWNLTTKSVTQLLVGHTGSVVALACHRADGLLVSGSFDTTVRIWNLKPDRAADDDRSVRQPIRRAVQ